MTTGGLDVGNLLGLVIVGTVATKMVDNMGNNNSNNSNNNSNNNQQSNQSQSKRKQAQKQSQTVAHKRTSHSGRGLLQPRTDGDKPF